MAVASIKNIYVSALKKDKRRLVEFLQRRGVVELIEFDSSKSRLFSLQDCSTTIAALQIDYEQVMRTKGILNSYSPEKVSLFAGLEGKKRLTVEAYEDFHARFEPALDAIGNICDTEDKITRAKDEILQMREKREGLRPWVSLDVPLNFAGTKYTAVSMGTLPKEYTLGDLKIDVEKIDENPEDFVFQIISASKEQTCITALSLKEHEERLKSVLEELQFASPIVMAYNLPRDEIRGLEESIRQKENLIDEYKSEIVAQVEYREDFNFLLDYISIQIEENKAFCQISESNYTFLLEGFVLEEKSAQIEQELSDKFRCVVRIEDVTEEDDVPSFMENNWFSEPVESVVASYNYPKYKELDPTTITSVFYYFMFGIMFSDAGYGAILVIACGFLLLKFKDMQKSTSKFLRLFFWCGVSTVGWGIVFSSYFGDVVDVFSNAFLGRSVTIPPLWFSPLQEPMKLLLFSLAIGIVHLSVGYVANAYSAIKNKDIGGVFYDSVAPVAFLYSLLVIFMGSSMFEGLSGFSLSLGEIVPTICLAVAALCAVTIVLTGGRSSKNWGKRLLKGAFEFYNVIAGWISDILSYSRLLALGLATGVIGSVVNTLGAMVGKGVAGMIVFVLVFILGHAMNFGINILGSYVHSNRLEYVEFFGKFYEGGGREFRPLNQNTKYYIIEEEV